MKDDKINAVVIDPHCDDFIFKPLSYLIAGRRPLQKYQYLGRYFKSSYYISGTSSSAPYIFIKFTPKIILLFINLIEVFFWKKINNIISRNIRVDELLKSTVFIFGYKKIDGVMEHLLEIGFKGKLIIHISHYHTFDIKEEYFKIFDITLAFDMDVTKCDFFIRKFPSYKKNIALIPFQLSKKYYNVDIHKTRTLRLLVAGTYHKDKKNTFGIQIDGYSTLHPHRLKFSMADNIPGFVTNRLSLYNSGSPFNLLKYKQKSYFSFDILKEFCNSSHAFIGSEVTGCFGIGTIEAMACGCIVFITKNEYDEFSRGGGNPDCILFDDFDDLIFKINKLNYGNYSPSIKNINISKNYYEDHLYKNFMKLMDQNE